MSCKTPSASFKISIPRYSSYFWFHNEGSSDIAIFSANNPRSMEECLAQELVMAANHDVKSYAVAKRLEIERIAKASR